MIARLQLRVESVNPNLHSPPSPVVPQSCDRPALLPISQYEEIQDVREIRKQYDEKASRGAEGQDSTSSPREGYKLTQCPAYAFTSTV